MAESCLKLGNCFPAYGDKQILGLLQLPFEFSLQTEVLHQTILDRHLPQDAQFFLFNLFPINTPCNRITHD